MRFNIKSSFTRIYKKLPKYEQEKVDIRIKELFAYYNKNVLVAGLKVRKLSGKDKYFEIDTESNRRILIRKEKKHDRIYRIWKS